jgi:stage V sporulation protein G
MLYNDDISGINFFKGTNRDSRVLGYFSFGLLDSIIVRDAKLIQPYGDRPPLISMPSRKRHDRCPECNGKNELRRKYCGDCGVRLPDNRVILDGNGFPDYYVDVVHPIDEQSRMVLHRAVVAEYERLFGKIT